MSCEFCDSDGQILVNQYAKKFLKPNGKPNIVQLKKGVFVDCPKCNGTGKAIE